MDRFIVVYRPNEADGIDIARVLHGMRQISAELVRDPGDTT